MPRNDQRASNAERLQHLHKDIVALLNLAVQAEEHNQHRFRVLLAAVRNVSSNPDSEELAALAAELDQGTDKLQAAIAAATPGE